MAPKKKDRNKRPKEKLVGVLKRPSRRLFTYKEEDLINAIESVKNKSMGFREACRFYGVPFATVHDRLSGKVALNKKPKVGPDPVLGVKNEEKLKTWIIDMAKCGFPLNKSDLLESVAKIIAESGAKTPFKDGKPGETWYQKFLKRHPEISIREPEGINNARAAITESRIKQWFKELKHYIESIGAMDIFEDPDRIFNGDESGFSLCPKSGKVLGPRGFKNVYIKKNNDKENLTVLLVFAASGKLCPPLVIFPYLRPPKALVDNMPKAWVLGRSESGWMKSDVFYEYISNDFNAWLEKNQVKKPIILFIDGHKSHMTFALSEFCQANGIILYALPPNSTHMLQPADVSVFRPLKQNWKTTVKQWQSENVNQVVTKLNFCSVLNKTISQTELEEAIRNGFRRCGLYPLNEDAVDYTKCVKDTQDRVGRERREKRVSNQKTTANAKEFDAAIKVISIIKTDLAKRNIDSEQILEEIKIAKDRYLENRRSKSKTPRNSTASNQSTSILSQNPNIENSLLISDTLCADESMADFPQPGSYISLNDISVMALDEIQITPDQCQYTLTVSADVHNNVQNGTFSVPADVHSDIQNDTLAVPADVNYDIQNDTLAVPAHVHNDKQSDTLAVLADVHNNIQNDTVLTIRDNVETEQILSFDDIFEKHLRFPSPTSTPSKEKKRNGPKLPSAISSDAWREHYKKKEEIKENLDLEKQRKKQLRAEEKEKREKEKQKRNKNKKTLLKKKPKKDTQTCSECCEELISDVEEDAEKNIGCDHCIRWYHLKCTEMRNKSYVEAATSSYTCPFCHIDNTQN